jgi:hypothetical protein
MYEGCTKKEKSLKSGDFSLFSCIFAKKVVSLQPQIKNGLTTNDYRLKDIHY